MERTHSFRDLIVWQKAHQFVLSIYTSTKQFPKEEIFALTNQVRRAAVSIAANITEGYKKKTIPSQLNYLYLKRDKFPHSLNLKFQIPISNSKRGLRVGLGS